MCGRRIFALAARSIRFNSWNRQSPTVDARSIQVQLLESQIGERGYSEAVTVPELSLGLSRRTLDPAVAFLTVLPPPPGAYNHLPTTPK